STPTTNLRVPCRTGPARNSTAPHIRHFLCQQDPTSRSCTLSPYATHFRSRLSQGRRVDETGGSAAVARGQSCPVRILQIQIATEIARASDRPPGSLPPRPASPASNVLSPYRGCQGYCLSAPRDFPRRVSRH